MNRILELSRLAAVCSRPQPAGASAIEYGLLAPTIALVIIAAVMTPGTNLNSLFSSISTSI